MANESELYYYLNTTNVYNNESHPPSSCCFKEVDSLDDLLALLQDNNCYRHSVFFTAFLCLANFIILLFGLLGNSVVIYVVTCRLKPKTASNIFILNLAIADLLVIICCIPATVISNIFTPWVFSEVTCKGVAYAQEISVICSVYSLVAISFDRCRALHPSMGITPNITSHQASKLVCIIWIIGSIVTLPWALVFHVTWMDHGFETEPSKLPFCVEVWQTKTEEAVYFFLVHVFACFVLPFLLITVCNIIIWKSVLQSDHSALELLAQISANSNKPDFRETQHQRKLRALKIFTALNFVFFLFWLPLYIIMAIVKFIPDEDVQGTTENKLFSVLVPIAQLLGTCNSCINPILYAFLSHKFRESFKLVFRCTRCSIFSANSISAIVREDRNAIVVINEANQLRQGTAV